MAAKLKPRKPLAQSSRRILTGSILRRGRRADRLLERRQLLAPANVIGIPSDPRLLEDQALQAVKLLEPLVEGNQFERVLGCEGRKPGIVPKLRRARFPSG